VAVWVFIGWAWGLYFTIMFDLGLGHIRSFAGANASTVALVALVTLVLAVARSSRKFVTLSRILASTVLLSALVGAVAFTLVRAYVPEGNAALVAGHCTGAALVNSIRQLRANKQDVLLRQLHATAGQP
jgi:hypothetical protein